MIGKTILHYKIITKLGEGGMGVVYKARDTKLDREVALKFLPSNSLATSDDKARFAQEAKAAAKLNHANIAHVYEINEHEGETFIAMEYVDGETLSDMIVKRPLRIKDAIEIAIQIAEGLHTAHEQGIVHRDIKSANIMITAKGAVKIMDFGLAKVAQASMLRTQAGTTLGTISYMSPEQSQGEKVDHRTDTWSLGVVLYEMVSGQMPFKGDYESAIIYSIMNEDPEPLTSVRSGVPMDLERIVNKLLAKEPDKRYQNIIELPVDLKNVSVVAAGTSNTSTSRVLPAKVKRKVPAGFMGKAAALLAVVLTFILAKMIYSTGGDNATGVIKYVAAEQQTRLSTHTPGLAISPDGQVIAFTDENTEGRKIYIRYPGAIDPIALEETKGAQGPLAFSPDGNWLAFSMGGKIVKILLSGGQTVTLASITADRWARMHWDTRDNINVTDTKNLYRISGSGVGSPEIVLSSDSLDRDIDFGQGVAGASSLLFSTSSRKREGDILSDSGNDHQIFAMHTGSTEMIKLLDNAVFMQYINTGHILYRSRERDGNSFDDQILAVPFDPETLTLTGSPIPLPDMNLTAVVSGNGSMVYSRLQSYANISNSLVQVDRNGNETVVMDYDKVVRFPRIKSDEHDIIFQTLDRGGNDIWSFNGNTKLLRRITNDGDNEFPIVSAADNAIIYFSHAERSIIKKNAVSGSSEVLLTAASRALVPNDITSDGRYLLYYAIMPKDHRDIWIYDLREKSSQPVAVTKANEHSPQFSPDGKWVAFGSDITGQDEIYVIRTGENQEPTQLTSNGGYLPIWSPRGNELFYRTDEEFIALELEMQPVVEVVRATVLFDIKESFRRSFYLANYDVFPDGNSFIWVKGQNILPAQQIIVVRNWFDELKALSPNEN